MYTVICTADCILGRRD